MLITKKGQRSVLQVNDRPGQKSWAAADLKKLSPLALGPHESAMHELHWFRRGLSRVRLDQTPLTFFRWALKAGIYRSLALIAPPI
jgi:hypothetical protein